MPPIDYQRKKSTKIFQSAGLLCCAVGVVSAGIFGYIKSCNITEGASSAPHQEIKNLGNILSGAIQDPTFINFYLYTSICIAAIGALCLAVSCCRNMSDKITEYHNNIMQQSNATTRSTKIEMTSINNATTKHSSDIATSPM